MKTIFQILGNADQPVLNYVWQASLVSAVPSIVIAAILLFTFDGSDKSQDGEPLWWSIMTTLVLAPWIETFFMWPIFSILKWAITKPSWIAAKCGVV